MRIGSLFSGYGGLDLAAMHLFSSDVAWHCEWDDAPAKILDHHWPTVPNYRDVTQVDWDSAPSVDILTGGYPCQPFSAAGQRKGTNDERHLWPYVRDAIRHLRPRYTLLENVAGHRSLGFDRVLGDLAEDGMHVRWTSIRASDIGAPHHRERLFILVTNPESSGPQGDELARRSRPELTRPVGNQRVLPDAHRERYEGSVSEGGAGPEWASAVELRRTPSGGGREVSADADCERRGQGAGQPGSGKAEESPVVGGISPLFDWGAYAPAVRRWERLTRPAPAPTELNSNGRPRLSAPFAEWMMGLPAGHVTNPRIGISRVHQLKAIGNGVCPQQAVAAYQSLLLGSMNVEPERAA